MTTTNRLSERNSRNMATQSRPLSVDAASEEPGSEYAAKARLWPVVLVLVVQAGLLLTTINPAIDNFLRFATLMAGPLLCGVLYFFLLIFASRIRRWEGTLVLLASAAIGITAGIFSAPRTEVAFWMYGFPLSLAMITVGLFVARAWNSQQRVGAVIASAALGWVLLSLIRIDGIDGSYVPEVSWRWTPTAEANLLAELLAERTSPATSSQTWVAVQEEWPGFRGADRASRVSEALEELDWDASPPEELWQRRVGPAWSSMCLVSGRLFTQEQRGDEEVVACYDAQTGEPICEHAEESRFEEITSGAGPRATPTFAEGRIYAYGARAVLVALDAATGAVLWRHDLMEEVDAPLPVWGFSSSPLVFENCVVVYAGGSGGNGLMAFDAETGEVVWSIPSQGMNFSSPQLIDVSGEKQIVFVEPNATKGFDPETAEQLWHYELGQESDSPLIQPQQIGPSALAVPLGDGVGVARIELSKDSSGKWIVDEVWRSRDLKPSFNDFVYYDGHIYGFDKEIFACIDAKTGKRMWKRGRYGFGQVLLLESAGQLVVSTEEGDLVLLEANPEALQERGRVKALSGKTWNHHAVADGRLYVRNAEEMKCLRLTKEGGSTPSS